MIGFLVNKPFYIHAKVESESSRNPLDSNQILVQSIKAVKKNLVAIALNMSIITSYSSDS